MGWGLQSHFHVQPNNCVEVVLRCVIVGVVLITVVVDGWMGGNTIYNGNERIPIQAFYKVREG